MKKLGFAAFAAMSAFAYASPALAQDAEPADAPLDWYWVTYMDIDDDRRDMVEEWQEKYIIPAHVAAGMVPPKFLHMYTGEWEMIRISHMPGMTDQISWDQNPYGAKVNAEILKLVGGQEQLDEWMKKLDGSVLSARSELGHIDKPE